MLVLTRKTNQSIVIGDDIEITVLSVSGDKVRIGIEAPRDIAVFRREVLDNELRNAWQVAYFESRMTGRIDQALALKLHARKRVLAFTRAENERRGRVIRSWGDGF